MPDWDVDERLDTIFGAAEPGSAPTEAAVTLRRTRDPKTMEHRPWTLWDELDDIEWRMVWVARFGHQQKSELEAMDATELAGWYEKVKSLVMAEAGKRALSGEWLD